jgi:phage tail-like protein
MPRDPLVSYRFLVELGSDIAASFTECSGLQGELEFEEYQEGGLNGMRHKLQKTAKWGNLTLRRGVTDSSELWDWFNARVQGTLASPKGERRDIAVILWDTAQSEQRVRWDVTGAYPVKWTGPELKGDSNTVAIEALELTHNGVARQ